MMSRTRTSPEYFFDDLDDDQSDYEVSAQSYEVDDYLVGISPAVIPGQAHTLFRLAGHELAARRATLADGMLPTAQERYTIHDDDAWSVVHWHPRFATTETYTAGVWVGRRPSSPPHNGRDIRDEFNAYRDEWKAQSEFLSSVTEMILLPAYQRIIGLGRPAIPLIIDELRAGVDHWFWALSAIAGADHAAGAATMSEAARRWIEWYDNQA